MNENHKKIIGKLTAFARPFLGNCYGEFIELIHLKAPGNYSASIWTYNFLNCLWENPKTLISMISGFSDVSLTPKTNYLYLLRHQDTSNNPRNPKSLLKIWFYEFQKVGSLINIYIYIYWKNRKMGTERDQRCAE